MPCLLDEGDELIGVDAVDPTDEAAILRAAQLGVEGAGKAHRPRDRARGSDPARGGRHGAGNHLQQRRLARAIAPQEPHRTAGGESHGDILHDAHPFNQP